MKIWEYYSPPWQNVACPQATAKVDAKAIFPPPNEIHTRKVSPFAAMSYVCPAPKLPF